MRYGEKENLGQFRGGWMWPSLSWAVGSGQAGFAEHWESLISLSD